MQELLLRRSGRRLGGIAVVLLFAAAGHADSPPASAQVHKAPPAAPHAKADANGYWLGVQCRPVDGALRAHLPLTASQGLVAEDVAPDSPAAKHGIQQYDVLVSVDGKPLQDIKDLVEAVDASGGKELSLEVIRGGENRKLTIQPGRRPKELSAAPRVPHVTGDAEIIRKWLEELHPGSSVRFRFFHRGSILPADAPAHPPLPENVTITVFKRGDELARLVVKRDSKKWEVTEHELDRLPEDLRPYAEQMLGRLFPAGVDPAHLFDFGPHLNGANRGESAGSSEADGVEKSLEAVNRQLEQLQQSLEQLQKQQPPKGK